MTFVIGEVDSNDITPAFATAITPGSGQDVGTTSTPVVAANANRKRLIVVNAGDVTVWLTLAATGAAVGNGIPLAAGGGSFVGDWAGAVSAIHGATGTKRVGFVEL